MDDDKFTWANETMLHPLGLVALVVMAAATLALPRRFAFVPMILLACLIPSRQRVVIATLDFTLLRLLVLVAWVRIVARGEAKLRFQALDYVLLASTLALAIVPTLRTGTMSTLVFNLGVAFDAIGMYFLFRVMIRNWADFRSLVTCLAVVSVPVAACFVVEASTGRNLFSVFGGVPEYTMIRDGRLRCQGPFGHPILAGAFWASLVPLFAARCWENGAGRTIGAVGVTTSLLVVALCASSTPIAGLGAVFVGSAFFPLRAKMRTVRWSLLGVLVGLHLVMNAPVWHLISRIDLVGGSTGWHRYNLIDQAIRRFGEWALLGTNSTAHWGHALGDVANQYVLTGTRGGFVSLALMIALLSLAYRDVGRLVRRNRRSRTRLIASWALGVSLFAHTLMFVAVSYFGQMTMAWYLQLALIGSLVQVSAPQRIRERATKPTSGGGRRQPEPRPVDGLPA